MWKYCSFRRSYSLFLVSTVFFLMSCGEQENKKEAQIRPVQAIQVSDQKSFNNRSFPGKAKAEKEVNLSFNVGGTLVELPIKIGDKVNKNQLIAKLDQREFDARVQSARAEMLRDEQNYLRAKTLVGKGHISKSDYDLLQAKYAMSQANMDLAQKSLTDSTIEAPFAGEIADRYVENHQTVSKQQVIARLLDTTQIEMIIQIPENAISLIPYVKNIQVEFDSFPGHFIPAEVKEISSEASLDTRTYPVTLVMQQPKNIEILPGMAGKAKGTVEKGSYTANTLNIPLAALISKDNEGKSYVWIVDEKTMRVHKREVGLGGLGLSGVEITKGLNSGEWVVIAGVHSLDEGEQVTILKQGVK